MVKTTNQLQDHRNVGNFTSIRSCWMSRLDFVVTEVEVAKSQRETKSGTDPNIFTAFMKRVERVELFHTFSVQ